jgi:alkylhydroperoxidase family enzyme
MKNPFYPPEVQKLVDAVLHSPAHCNPQLRQDVEAFAAACSGAERVPNQLPEALRPYLEKVNRYAYKVTDKDVAHLKTAGYDEDALFELTVCASLGSALARLEKTMALLNEGAQ